MQFWALGVNYVLWEPSSTWAETERVLTQAGQRGGDCILTCHRTALWDKPARYHSLRRYPRPYLWFRHLPRLWITSWSKRIILITIRTACSHVTTTSFCLALEFLCLFIIQFFTQWFTSLNSIHRWSRWLRGLRRGSAAARLLGLRVRNPPGARMSCLLWVLCVVS